MKANVETITPAKAKQLLLGSEEYQRNVSESHVAHLAKQMIDGKWRLNGETIVISTNDQVIDGQHRLLAVIRAARPVQMMVVYGVDRDCFHTLDTGKSRSPGNTMHIAGIKNAVTISGMLTFRWKYLKAEARGGSLNMWERPTHGELVEYATINEQMVHSAVCAMTKVRKVIRGVNPSTLGGSYIVFCEKTDTVTCAEFYSKLALGEELNKNNPVLTLRNRLINSCVGPSDLKWQVKAAYLFMAYKKYVECKPLSLLRWTEGKDKFPFI
jgi:hypothetical protein